MAIKIRKIHAEHLRNGEHVQMIVQTLDELAANDPEKLNIKALYDELAALSKEEEATFAVEQGSMLTAARTDADINRDRLHRAMYFNIKSLTLLNEQDDAGTYNAARRIMRIFRQVGSLSNLAFHAETSVIERLVTELEQYAGDIEATGTRWLLDRLIAANNRFVALDKEYRDELSARPSGSVTAVRKKINPVYTGIVDALNADIARFRDGRLDDVAAGLNVIVKRFSTIIAQRRGRHSSRDETAQQPGDSVSSTE